MPVTFGSLRRGATDVAIAAWNAAEVASAPGCARVKSARRLLLPPPNSAARRLSTCEDSESGSSQPPEVSFPDAREANGSAATATTRAIRATIRRCR